MGTTVTSTGITFPDATTQTTAFTGAVTGPRAIVLTAAGSSTFTIPAGVTSMKVTVIGSGGGGVGNACGFTTGGSGNTSSVSSGTQTISTISATGGAGGVYNSLVNGGLGSGGDINGRGGNAGAYGPAGGFTIFSSASPMGNAGLLGAGGGGTTTGTILYSGAGGGVAIKWLTGLTPGNTLNYTVGTGGAGGTGGGALGGDGVIIFEY